MKIMVVEDDFAARLTLQSFLDSYGRVDTAEDGEQAVDLFKKAFADGERYDLILLDIMMPRMHGHEALRQIRSHEREQGVRDVDEVKVIMVSALADPKNVIQAYHKGGATSYITKPIDFNAIIETIVELGLLEPGRKEKGRGTEEREWR